MQSVPENDEGTVIALAFSSLPTLLIKWIVRSSGMSLEISSISLDLPLIWPMSQSRASSKVLKYMSLTDHVLFSGM